MSSANDSEGPDPTTASSFRWLWFRLGRHLHWARTQGVGRLIEEDQLNPFDRIPNRIRKAAWRRGHDSSPRAVPVFIVGLQRSGTNLLARGLERAPEVEVHNENDREAFMRFRLRPAPVIRAIVVGSKHSFVLFKPLCDSHRTPELLDGLATPSPGRAIWAYRAFEGRVRSSVAKFGASNLRSLRRISEGTAESLWQAGGLSDDSLELIRSFEYDRMTPESASALFWFVRNRLYFDLGLDRRSDVTLASYEAMVSQPEHTMRSLCAFLDLSYRRDLIAGIEPRHASSPGVDIDPVIRARCVDLEVALDEARYRQDAS